MIPYAEKDSTTRIRCSKDGEIYEAKTLPEGVIQCPNCERKWSRS